MVFLAKVCGEEVKGGFVSKNDIFKSHANFIQQKTYTDKSSKEENKKKCKKKKSA